jgi:hypothetical protein
MAKRIVTKPGFVYSANIDGKYKRYFQYICKDASNLYSEVIKVFKPVYPIEASPDLEHVVKEDVLFYAHTIICIGIHEGIWKKEGKQPVDNDELSSILFGSANLVISPTEGGLTYKIPRSFRINPPRNWYVWKVNGERIFYENLPTSLYDKLELGDVYSFRTILSRMKYGVYYTPLHEYSVIRHDPLPNVDIYLKRETDGNLYYFHYRGNTLVEEMIITNSTVIRLSEEKRKYDGYELTTKKFGETYCSFDDFITEEEFLAAWNQSHDTIHSDIEDSHHADVKDTNHTDIKDEIMKEEVFQSDANNDSDNVEYIMRNDYLSVFPNGAGEVTVYFDIESEVPYEIGNQMEEIDDRAYMNGCGWEGLLNFVIKTRHPELADTFETDCEGGTYVALFPDDAEGVKNARKLGEIIVSLIDNKEELFRIVREHADDICWDELDCED